METKQELGPLQKSWVAALRSGKYEQGRLYLNLGGKFCCLGVACDISRDVLKLDVGVRKLRSGKEVTWYNGAYDNLSSEVTEHFMFRSMHGGIRKLITLNDSKGKTFDDIADIVEENPEHYFTEGV